MCRSVYIYQPYSWYPHLIISIKCNSMFTTKYMAHAFGIHIYSVWTDCYNYQLSVLNSCYIFGLHISLLELILCFILQLMLLNSTCLFCPEDHILDMKMIPLMQYLKKITRYFYAFTKANVSI